MNNTSRRDSLASSLLALGAACALHGAAKGQTRVIYVDESAPAGGNGTSWISAYRQLQSALAEVNAGVLDRATEVRVAQGTYRAIAGAGISAFEIRGTTTVSGLALNIFGAFAGLRSVTPDARDYVVTPTFLTADVLGDDGPNFTNRSDNKARTVRVELNYGRRPALSIDGFVIRGGHATNGQIGGGIDAFSGFTNFPMTISRCRIEDNQGDEGGGINFREGRVSIESCTISGNRSLRSAGGVMLSTNLGRLSGSMIVGNSAVSAGGGVYCGSGGVRIDRCVIAANTADIGGGVGGDMRLSNSLITANTSPRGGGIWGNGTVMHCTIVRNNASVAGHAVFGTNLTLNGCVIHLNGPSDQSLQMHSDGSRDTLTHSLLLGGFARIDGLYRPRVGFDATNMDAQPLFADPDGPDNNPLTWQDNDYRLLPGSPAIDAGDPDVPLSPNARDLDGRPRFLPGVPGAAARADMGCYEAGSPPCAADLDDGSNTGTRDGGVTVEDLLYFLARFTDGC